MAESPNQVSNPNTNLYLKWKNLRYYMEKDRPWNSYIKTQLHRKKDQLADTSDSFNPIIDGVSGEVRPGEIIAIMGPSGSGKTALLDILAGRTETGILEGEITVNTIRRPSNWRRLIGHVPTKDYLFGELTVRETLEFAAAVKLPRSMKKEQRKQRVDYILQLLGIEHCADHRVSTYGNYGMSGGEYRRTSIGVALITNPRILFLDEPTSGLDAFTAQSVMEALYRLAKEENRTIILTINQPRASILALFSRILLLSEGRTAFFGSLDEALSHFKSLGFQCPEQENPADYFLDILTDTDRVDGNKVQCDGRRDKILAAWKAIERKRHLTVNDETRSIKRHRRILDPELGEYMQNSSQRNNDDGFYQKNIKQQSIPSNEPVPIKSEQGSATNREVTEAQLKLFLDNHKWPNHWLTEFYELLKRDFRIQTRDYHYLLLMFLTTTFLSLFSAFIFFQLPNTFDGVQGRRGLCFFLPCDQILAIVTILVLAISPSRANLVHERKEGMYRMSSTFMAKFVSSMPYRLFLVLMRSFILYWIVGFRTDGFQYFLIFAGILLVHGFCSIAYGILANSFHGHPGKTLTIATLYNFTMNLYGGNFANSAEVTWILRWIQFLSPTFYGFEALIQNELSGQTFNGIPGDFYLDLYDFDTVSIVGCVGALAGLSILYLLIGYLVLYYLTRPRFKLI